MKQRGIVTALVGAQFGSEGKGVVAQKLAPGFDYFVRTGAPNAGHSLVHKGQLFKMQTIPCGWVKPNSTLIIGAGGLINIGLFFNELEDVCKVDPSVADRIFIDGKCGIIEDRNHHEEGGVDGELHKRMGSTGEGVGAARRDRMARDPDKFRLAAQVPELKKFVRDTQRMLCDAVINNRDVMLEGTQGCGLSLIHGTWPHVTTNDTNAAQLAADCGLPPQWVREVVLVARTFPIRVAGKSGPMFRELDWQRMSERVGRPVEEKTTVTKKVRRIGEWDEELFGLACRLNAPSRVALTFMDYLDPASRGVTEYTQLGDRALDFVCYVERAFRVKVGLVGTGWDEKTGWVCVELL